MSTFSSSIQAVLENSESQLSKLISQAKAIEALQQIFASILDNELLSQCRVGCYESGILTLFTPNAAVATRLRYHVPTLMSQLRSKSTWVALRSIQVKVHTQWEITKPQEEPKPQETAPLKISGANAAQMQALADSLKGQPGMEKLIESLERIAKKG